MSTANATIDELAKREFGQEVTRQTFGSTEVQQIAETAASATAEREKATIGAIFIMAERHPRNLSRFEAGLLKECERPGFAEVARYKKPQRHRNAETNEWENGFVEGWSIRFAEAAMRWWMNVFCDSKIVYEDERKRIVRFMCIDLENNIPLCSEIQLNKTVERRGYVKNGRVEPPAGKDVLDERKNSNGDTVYIVASTEDELQMKQASAWSKFIRNVLRFMPGDILDKCEEQIQATLKGLSSEAALERIVKAFDAKSITVADLQMYLGHSVSKITSLELNELRGVYTAVKEGETWQSILDGKNPSGSVEAAAKVAEEKLAKMQQEQSAPAEPSVKPISAIPWDNEEGRNNIFFDLRKRLVEAMDNGPKEYARLMQSFGTGQDCDPFSLTTENGEAAYRQLLAVVETAEAMAKPTPAPAPPSTATASSTAKRWEFGRKPRKE